MANKVLVAMSGGVDSAVAALLCREAGFDCVGVTMRLRKCQAPDGTAACGERDIEDARVIAAALGMPHMVCDLSDAFDRAVVSPFVSDYEAGMTPNPCIRCNRHIKFSALMDYAEELGCDYVATGHYARLGRSDDGMYYLRRAANIQKDQSYVLYSLSQAQLSHTLFPLGGFDSKDEIRAMAEARGLPVAHKGDSQDICFVPDGDYAAFIERYTGKTYPAGDFLDGAGNRLGTHRGLIRYTVGQRRGLGLSLPASLYVKEKDVTANTVTLVPDAALYSRALYANDVLWCSGTAPSDGCRVTVKTRYRAKEVPATVFAAEGGIRVVFDTPERAITPGQAAVLYRGDILLGGGTIVSSEP